MIHLIWTKDNSSTNEDGKELKGVRSKLVEVYRILYFDPVPDLEPKQQVNRIAKNMIECVCEDKFDELHPDSRAQADVRRDVGRVDVFGGTHEDAHVGRTDPPRRHQQAVACVQWVPETGSLQKKRC